MKRLSGTNIEHSPEREATERDFERGSEGGLILAAISAASGAFVGFCFAGDLVGAFSMVPVAFFGAFVGWWSRGLLS